MRGPAHAAVGAVAAIPLALLVGTPFAIPLALAGAFGGLLPDIDHPGSTLGRWVPWPAAGRPHGTDFVLRGRRWFGGHTVWHRHETHSLGAAVAAAALATLALWWPACRLVAWGRLHDGPGPAAPLWLLGLALAALIGAGMLAGYLSHLVLDLPQPSPQMLLWPFSRRMLRPRWLPRVAESSFAGRLLEGAVIVAAAGFALVLWRGRVL